VRLLSTLNKGPKCSAKSLFFSGLKPHLTYQFHKSIFLRRKATSGLLRRVALVRSDVSEEFTRATRRNIPEDAILHSHRRENLKSYVIFLWIRARPSKYTLSNREHIPDGLYLPVPMAGTCRPDRRRAEHISSA
jgi:hypothetical protein